MTVSARIKTIIEEKHLNQKQFAESIFVTEGYISRLLKDGVGISNSRALLIEKVHGYAKDWILNGTEPKSIEKCMAASLNPIQRKIIDDIELMNDDELFFITTYIDAVKKKKGFEKADQAVKEQE
ncbi:MAG: hypothetical protein Ta2B_24030 [Termitinemataceae bacterium]|nr:MAG: hypothetical protein Ta2B_24030 [Termitinemataceae bacterium]